VRDERGGREGVNGWRKRVGWIVVATRERRCQFSTMMSFFHPSPSTARRSASLLRPTNTPFPSSPTCAFPLTRSFRSGLAQPGQAAPCKRTRAVKDVLSRVRGVKELPVEMR
jgi:hypothetical protein